MSIRKLLKQIESMSVMNLQPGDCVIIRLKDRADAEHCENLLRGWEEYFPGVKAIVLDASVASLTKSKPWPSTVPTQEMIDDMCLAPPACEWCKTLFIETTKAGDEFRSYAKACECAERRHVEPNPEPAPAMVEVTQDEWDAMTVEERRAKHINIVRLPGGFRIPVTDLANLFK